MANETIAPIQIDKNFVGIGTAKPVQKLHVQSGNINLTTGNYITWNNGDSQIKSVSGYHLTFLTWTGSSMTEKLRITSGGNVGIGTTSPGFKFHVDYGAPASADRNIAVFQAEDTRRIGFVWDDSLSSLGIATLTSHKLAFHTGGNSNPRLTIDTAGNVGIGKSSGLGSKLDILGSNNAARINVNDGTGGLTMGHWDGNYVRIEASGRALGIFSYGGNLSLGMSGTPSLTINSSHNITTIGNIYVADNKKILFGAGNDLQIHHAVGDNLNFIQSPSIGLHIRTPDFRVLNGAGTERMIQADDDGEVSLWYNNSKKLGTTNTGISVTGDIVASGAITATQLNVETVNKTVLYSSGSTKFGDSNDDIHSMTGSLNVYQNSVSGPGPVSVAHFVNNINQAGSGSRITMGHAGGQYSVAIGAVNLLSSPSYLQPAMGFYTMHNASSESSLTERMRLNSLGRLLINTTTDTGHHLSVNGAVKSAGALTIGSEVLNTNFSSSLAGRVATLQAASSGFSVTNSSNNRVLTSVNSTTGNAEANLIFTGTKLGVNVNPNKTLQVDINNSATDLTAEGLAGGTAGAGVLLHNTNSTNNSYVNLDFRAYDADARIAVQRTAANSSDMHFIMDNTNSPASMMVIKNDGKVGIGEISPDTLLHLKASAPALRLEGTGNSARDYDIKTDGNEIYIEGVGGSSGGLKVGENGTYNFTVDLGDGNTYIAGNVGIGTTVPGVAKLNVFGSSAGTPFLYVGDGTPNNDSSWDANIMLDSNQHSRFRIENRGDNKNLQITSHVGYEPAIFAADSATEIRMGVGGTTSLEIGTNPYLDVKGRATFAGEVEINSNDGIDVNAGAATLNASHSGGTSALYSGYGFSTATSQTIISNATTVHLKHNTTSRLTVSESRVGIGTENPRQTFTVASGRANFDTQNNYYGVTIDGNTSGNNAVQVGQWHNVGGRMQSGADYHLKLQTHNFAHDVLLQSGSAAGDGFVGIGTDDASAKLHVFRHSTNFFKVQNESQLRANTSGIGFEVTNMDSTGTSLRIGTSATAPSFIVKGGTSGGNVGIGTGSPDSVLEVRRDETATESNIRGNINYSAITIQGDYTNSTYLPALSWATADNVPTAPKASIYIHQDNTGSTMILGTSNSYAGGVTNNALCLDPTGQVGIGTQSPIRMLDIVASSGDPGIRLESAAQSMDVITLRNADGRVGFGGDVITVNSSKVGIGEISPGYPLEVVGATGNTVAKFGQNMALHMIHNAPVVGFNLYYNSGYKFGEGSSSSYGGYLALSTGTGKFTFATSNAGNAGGAATMAERVTILNDGKVGIGTNNPQKMLEVIVGENNFASFATQFSPGSHAGIHFGYRENNNSYRHSQLRFQRTDRFANNAMGRVMLINKTGTDSANPGESDAHLTIDELGFVGIGRNVGGHYSTGPRIQALLHVSASGTVVGSTTASLYVEGSGSEVVSVDGTLGRLFTVSDNFSGSLFSANTISGTPVIEAFSDNSVHLGPFSNPIQVTSLGHISGSSITTASFGRLQVSTLAGNSPLTIDSSLRLGSSNLSDVYSNNLVIASTTPAILLDDKDVSNLRHSIVGGGNVGLEISADIHNQVTSYIRLGVSGTEQARLVTGGNLQIRGGGTSNKLSFSDAGNVDAGYFMYDHNNGHMRVGIEDSVRFLVAQTQLKYAVGGNANNLSADGTFSIFNTHNTTWNALQLKNLHGNGSNLGTSDIIGDVVASNGQIARGRIQFRERTADSPNSEIAFFTSHDTNTEPTERVVIDMNGSMLVKGSNNSAGDTFTVVGSGNVPHIKIQNTGTTSNNNSALFFKDNDADVAAVICRYTDHSPNNAQLRFATTSAGTTRERVVIDEAGEVGIGTMTPHRPLHVYKSELTKPVATFQNGSGNGYFGIALGYDPANNDYLNTWGSQYSSGANVIGYAVKPSHTTNDVFLSAADNSGFGKGALVIDNEMRYYNAAGSTVAVDSVVSMTERFTVLQNGNVGIGSSTPQQKLDVGNNLRVTNSIYVNNMGLISWDSGTSTFRVYATSGNKLTLGADGTTNHVTITENGVVGINDGSPDPGASADSDRKLHVVGGISVSSGYAISYDRTYMVHAYQRFSSGVSTEARFQHYGYYGHLFATRTGNTMVIRGDAQRVGIGNLTPGSTLDVTGEVRGQRFAFNDDTNTYMDTVAADQIGFILGANIAVKWAFLAGAYGTQYMYGGGAAGTPSYAWNSDQNTGMYNPAADSIGFSTGGTHRVRINNTGVGIGTATVDSPLHVYGGTANTAKFQSNSGATNLTFENSSGDLIGQMEFNSGTSQIVTRNSSTLKLGSNNVGTVYITDDDFVGIGTATVDTLFHMFGDDETLFIEQNPLSAGGGRLYISAAGAASNANSAKVQLHNAGMMWGRTDGSGIRIGSTDQSQVWFRTGNQYAEFNGYVDVDNYVKTGNGSAASPAIQLGSDNDGFFHHTDGVKVLVNNANEGLFENGGDFHSDGDVIAFSTTISDERVKTDVKTIESAVDKVSKIRGVEYTWTHGKRKGKKDIGVIAQEVEKVLPEIVHEKNMPLWKDKGEEVLDKYKTVDYEKLTAVLVESVKEQQEQINQLKLEIEELKNGSSK